MKQIGNFSNGVSVNCSSLQAMRAGNWRITCKDSDDYFRVMLASEVIGFKWDCYKKQYDSPFGLKFPLQVGGEKDKYLTLEVKDSWVDLTDRFFVETDLNLKPRNKKQEYLVQVLLAFLNDVPVFEIDTLYGCLKSIDSHFIYLGESSKYLVHFRDNYFHEDKWAMIDKKWQYIALDKNLKLYIYTKQPELSDDCWIATGDNEKFEFPFSYSTKNVSWIHSLRKRP